MSGAPGVSFVYGAPPAEADASPGGRGWPRGRGETCRRPPPRRCRRSDRAHARRTTPRAEARRARTARPTKRVVLQPAGHLLQAEDPPGLALALPDALEREAPRQERDHRVPRRRWRPATSTATSVSRSDPGRPPCHPCRSAASSRRRPRGGRRSEWRRPRPARSLSHRVPHRHRGQRRVARRVVDGFETEDGDDARGARFLDAPAEGAGPCRRPSPACRGPSPGDGARSLTRRKARRRRCHCGEIPAGAGRTDSGTMQRSRRQDPVAMPEAVLVHRGRAACCARCPSAAAVRRMLPPLARRAASIRARRASSRDPATVVSAVAPSITPGIRKSSSRLRDLVAVGEQRHALHGVGQLADVAGPAMSSEDGARVGRERAADQAVVGAGPGQKVVGQDEDVRAAHAQRRQLERDDREPMIEILAEATRRRRRAGDRRSSRPAMATSTRSAWVLPRRRTARSSRTVSSLPCSAVGRSPISSKNTVPPCAVWTRPALAAASIGEGPALVPEQLRLEQGLGDGGAVDVDERTAATRSGLVDGPGEEPLAGAGLAEDQDGRQPARRRSGGRGTG
mgnify:CR=1 FL=1